MHLLIQRRQVEVAGQFDVVIPHQGDIIRNLHSQLTDSVKGTDRLGIVDTENSIRKLADLPEVEDGYIARLLCKSCMFGTLAPDKKLLVNLNVIGFQSGDKTVFAIHGHPGLQDGEDHAGAREPLTDRCSPAMKPPSRSLSS